jgi:hypothetical protein
MLGRRCVIQDVGLQPLERGSWLQAKLFGKLDPSPLISLECVRPSLGAVEGEHQLRGRALAERILSQQLLELADETSVPSKLQVGVDPSIECEAP